MHIFKAILFLSLMVGSLVIVTYYFLGWSFLKIALLFLIGGVFVLDPIWGYKQMYHEEE